MCFLFFIYLALYHSNQTYTIQECGVLLPNLFPVDTLYAGQVGYAFANIRGGGDKGVEWAQAGKGDNKQI